MTRVTPLPVTGEAFVDARGGGRALRVTWHGESDLVVLSLWQQDSCVGSFRLAAKDVPALVDLLRAVPTSEAPTQPDLPVQRGPRTA